MHGGCMVVPYDELGGPVSKEPLPHEGFELYEDISLLHIHPRKRYPTV